MSYKINRIYTVKKTTGLSRSTIYLKISKGEFPKSIKLGDRAVGWLEEDIQNWLADRVAASKEEG